MSSPSLAENRFMIERNVQSDADFEQVMCPEEGFSGENDFTWLSSATNSSSYLSREELQSLEGLEMDYLLCQESMNSSRRKIFTRTDTYASLLDLEREDMTWDREEMDPLGPDFPSPRYCILERIKTRSPSLLGFSPASPGSVFQLSPAGNGGDEPLFWPFNRRSYSELQENYLGISPRASMIRIKKRSSSKSFQLRVQKSGEECPRRGATRGIIAISSRWGRSALVDRRVENESKKSSSSQVSRTGRGPSRLSRSSHHQLNSVRKKSGVNMKASLVQWLLEFEAGYFQVFITGGMSIESLVGLEEFDGH